MPRKRKGRGQVSIGYRRKQGRKSTENSHQVSTDTDKVCLDFFLPSECTCTTGDCTCESNSYSGNDQDEYEDFEGSTASEFYLVADRVLQLSPTDDSDTIYFQRMLSHDRYEALRNKLWTQSQNIQEETEFVMLHSDTIKFVQIYDTKCPGVKLVATINPETFTASVCIHQQPLNLSHELWKQVPKLFYHYEDIITLLRQVTKFSVCVGNPDQEFQSFDSGSIAFREPNFGAISGNLEYDQTIRHTDCELLLLGVRCIKCMDLRGSLRKKKSRQQKRQLICNDTTNIISKRTSHSNMSREMLCEKVNALQKERYCITAENHALKKKLQTAIEVSQPVSQTTSDDINQMVMECGEYVTRDFTDNSFERLFWHEQLKYNKCKQPSSMRWHPMIIKWCLQIKGRSSKAYETLRNIGFVKLPSSRTLYNYSHFMQASCGISVETQNHLIAECKAKGIFDIDWKTYVGLLHDEIKIKEDLVYDKHTGELIGFIDLDKTGNQLIELEHNLNGSSHELAKSMLVVMVRGIATDLKYPLACYSTNGITADFLYPVIYKAIRVLEVHVGLKVLFITCDGASSNRKLFSMHGSETTNWTKNPYDPDRKIFFIADVPHLIKTCRNCFANSDSHTRSRKLWNAGKSISWMHIVDLYNVNVKGNLYTHCPKLTKQHIDSHSKMNVSLAAQVLSSTVANALEHLFGEDVSETVKFIRYIDKFFDCMNTKNLNEGIRKRKLNLNPYKSQDDERLKWLENDFLQYLTNWETSVKDRSGDFSPKQRSAMQLSHQTLTGLKITVLSIVELVKFLLGHGVPFVLTNVFNQDPLEQQFGHCRHMGGSHENPRVYDVRHSINRLRVMGSTALASSGGNTKNQDDYTRVVDNTPLPKRPRKN